MADDEGLVEGQDPGPIETGPVLSIAPDDPGPIEIGLVMKTATPAPHDLLSRIIRTQAAVSVPTTRVHPTAADHADAGAAYGQLIADQLTQERSRKTSLESRGVTVITTSGTLVTLLFGLTAGLTAASGFKLPSGAKLPLLLALIAFVIAAGFGILTNMPLRYQEATPEGLGKLVNAKYWTAPATTGELGVAAAQVALLSAARSADNLKVRLLIVAISAELLAVAFLAWAVAVILWGSS
jgi:hypothetical protein